MTLTPAQMRLTAARIKAERARRNLYEFVKQAWPTMEPASPFKDNWHIQAICDCLEQVAKGNLRKLVINVPPGHAKPVDADSLVLVRDKGRIRLRDVVVGDEIQTHRGRFRQVEAVHEQGCLPTLRVTTWSGREMVLGLEHPVLTPRGWVQAKDLVVGDTAYIVHAEDVRQEDEIVSIESAGERECRCLTVAEDASFTVSDIAVHNSLLVSVAFPSWVWTWKPDWRSLFASYSEQLTVRDAVKSRTLMMSQWYRESFILPGVSNHAKPLWAFSDDSNRKDLYTNTATGHRISITVGAKATGFRGNLCLHGDSLVTTEVGPVTIRQLFDDPSPPRVLARLDGRLEWCRIRGARRTHNTCVGSISTTQGRRLWLTSDHRIAVRDGELDRYDEARKTLGLQVPVLRHPNLTPGWEGDSLFGVRGDDADVLGVRRFVPESGGRSRQSYAPMGSDAHVLEEVYVSPCAVARTWGSGTEPTARDNEGLPVVRQGVSNEGGDVPSPLLPRMLQRRSGGGGSARPVSVVRRVVSDDEFSTAVLWDEVQEQEALLCDAGGGQLSLQARAELPPSVPAPQASHQGTGRSCVRNLPFPGDVDSVAWTRAVDAGGASRRPSTEEQQRREPDNALLNVPCEAPSLEVDTVSSTSFLVEGCCDVYDLEVEGAHCFFANGILVHNCAVDDPINATAVESEVERESVIHWWTKVMPSRVNDPMRDSFLVIMQRLHQQDLTGFLLENGGYEHLCLPSEFDEKRRSRVYIRKLDETGFPEPPTLFFEDPRKTQGELLFPSLYPQAALDDFKRPTQLGERGFATQHDQLPSQAGGGMFRDSWWRFWRKAGDAPLVMKRPEGCFTGPATNLPRIGYVLASLDCTFKDNKDSDYVVLTIWGARFADRFLLDRFRGQLNSPDTCKMLQRYYERWRRFDMNGQILRCMKWLVEDKANGPSVIQSMRSFIPGLVEVNPEGGKKGRAAAMAPWVEAGNVYLPDGADWLEEFIEEFSRFPAGKHDDQVDSSSQAITHMLTPTEVMRAQAMSTM